MRALIVESTPMFQRKLASIYEALEFDVEVVETGKEALDLLFRVRFDTVCVPYLPKDNELSDYRDLVSQIREMPEYESVPIVLVTSNQDSEESAALSAAYDFGITEIFRKNQNGFEDLSRYLEDFKKYSVTLEALKGTILLVSEELYLVDSITKYFSRLKLGVLNLTSPEEAESIALATDVDLIITSAGILGTRSLSDGSHHSEQQSGMSLVRKLRATDARLTRVPVLALVPSANAHQKLSIYQTGANDCIQGEFSLEELAVRCKNLIENKQFADTIEVQKKELKEKALHDQLTGLYNRHFLVESIQREVSNAARDNQHLSIMVIDLDHFKKVNDTYGHAKGDEVLKEVANLLTTTFRLHDTVTRFGGEEFVIMLCECTAQDAVNRGNYLQRLLHRRKPGGLNVTASIGVSSILPGTNYSYEELFEAADAAVYKAKSNGRDQIIHLEIGSEDLAAALAKPVEACAGHV